jgi:hypothetical protein
VAATTFTAPAPKPKWSKLFRVFSRHSSKLRNHCYMVDLMQIWSLSLPQNWNSIKWIPSFGYMCIDCVP